MFRTTLYIRYFNRMLMKSHFNTPLTAFFLVSLTKKEK